MEKSSEEEVPAKTEKSLRAAEYPRLEEIYEKLQQQNRAIAQKEQRIENLEMELQECKGIFKGKNVRSCREKIEQTKKQLEPMKQRLTDIVTSCGYQNIRAFLVDHEKSRAEYEWYKCNVSDWERTYGKGREEQPKSIQ